MFFSGVFSSQISFVIMFMGLVYYIAQAMIIGVDKIQHLLVHEEKNNNTAQIYDHTSSTPSGKADYHFEQYRKSRRYISPTRSLPAITEKLFQIMERRDHPAISYHGNIYLPFPGPDTFENRAPPVC